MGAWDFLTFIVTFWKSFRVIEILFWFAMLWDVSLSLNYDDDEISDLTVVLNYLGINFLLFT